MAVGKSEVVLPLLSGPPVVDRARTDGEDFTFPEELEDGQFPSSSSSGLNGSDGGSDTEYKLTLAILNKEPYQSDLRGYIEFVASNREDEKA